MNDLMNCYGNWAAVAGAAEGIGKGFTRLLADLGFNLILVDHNNEKLITLTEKLSKKNNQEFIALHIDLSLRESPDVLADIIHSKGCRLLIYVAAFSKVGNFETLTQQDLDQFVDTNARSVIQLAHRFCRLWSGNGRAGLLLISSLAGIVGPPLVASYAATKGFINLLAESLHHEMKEKGIDVTSCCAGVTTTPMFLSTQPAFGLFKPQVQKPEAVAARALKMLGIKAVCISGWGNRAAYFLLTRILPRRLAGWLVARNMRNMYPD